MIVIMCNSHRSVSSPSIDGEVLGLGETLWGTEGWGPMLHCLKLEAFSQCAVNVHESCPHFYVHPVN